MRPRIFVLVAAVLFASQGLVSQQKPIHFKKLQEFLPKGEISGFVRGKPTGETASFMGFASSNAGVRYETPAPNEETPDMGEPFEPTSLEIKITDMVSIPAFAWLTAFQQADYEQESEEGYQKSTKIQGYPALEKAETGEYKSCELTISVGNRFFVELSLSNRDDMVLIKGIAEKMDLKGLEKLAGASKD